MDHHGHLCNILGKPMVLKRLKKTKMSTSKAARTITYNMNFYIPLTTKINNTYVVLAVIGMD
jgi:putative Mn2+ efflux pump MntP